MTNIQTYYSVTLVDQTETGIHSVFPWTSVFASYDKALGSIKREIHNIVDGCIKRDHPTEIEVETQTDEVTHVWCSSDLLGLIWVITHVVVIGE